MTKISMFRNSAQLMRQCSMHPPKRSRFFVFGEGPNGEEGSELILILLALPTKARTLCLDSLSSIVA
jgi:hypothetical protein